MQEEMVWESAFVFWSDGGWFSFDQFACLDWVEGALGAEALALWPPITSPPSLSSVEADWKKKTDRRNIIYIVGAEIVLCTYSLHSCTKLKFLLIIVKGIIYNDNVLHEVANILPICKIK